MSKALVIIKSMGIGDLVIKIANIHAVSKFVGKPVTVLAQKNTNANAILDNDPNVEEVIELDKKGFFNIIKKIKSKNFEQSYIYSDSIRLFLISKFSGIKKIFHYKFLSKKKKNFYKTAKYFSEQTLGTQIDHESKIFLDKKKIEESKKKYNISNQTKNIVCGISASGPTKRWGIKNYIKLFSQLNEKFQCKFFIAAGPKDEDLVKEIMNSSLRNKCIFFSKMTISEAMPIMSACKYYIGNDTGWGQISAALNLQSLFIFCDSPSEAYGTWRKNIKIVVPEGLKICEHNTRGKDKVSFNEVFAKSLDLIN